MAWVAAVAHAATHRSGGPLAYAGLAALWAREERTLAAWLPKRRCSVACALVAAQHRPLTFDPPGARNCMVVVVNGLLSNGRLPHAYYYKRPRPVEWLNHLYAGGLREHWAHA